MFYWFYWVSDTLRYSASLKGETGMLCVVLGGYGGSHIGIWFWRVTLFNAVLGFLVLKV